VDISVYANRKRQFLRLLLPEVGVDANTTDGSEHKVYFPCQTMGIETVTPVP